MKTIITKITTLTVILLMAINIPLSAITQASPDKDEYKKYVIFNEPVIRSLAEALELSDTQIAILTNQLEEIKLATITIAEHELDLNLDTETMTALGLEEDVKATQMEDWMFADDYYNEEYENSQIEPWMMEELLPAEEELVFEDWMFEELTKK